MLRDKTVLIAEIAKNQRKAFAETLKANKKKWRRNYDAIQKLIAIGLYNQEDAGEIEYNIRCGLCLKVDVTELPKLRAVFPKVKDTGNYELENANEQTIRVILDLGIKNNYWQGIEVYYVKTLPEDAKCKIVEQVSPASTYKTLQCSVD